MCEIKFGIESIGSFSSKKIKHIFFKENKTQSTGLDQVMVSIRYYLYNLLDVTEILLIFYFISN